MIGKSMVNETVGMDLDSRGEDSLFVPFINVFLLNKLIQSSVMTELY